MAKNYEMGLLLGGVDIPDPAKWSFEIADLDVSAERDAAGELHRDWVAQKINYSMTFNALTWEEMASILNAVNSPEFTAVMPDPYTAGGTHSGRYYVNNRGGDMLYYWPNTEHISLFNLTFKIIEY